MLAAALSWLGPLCLSIVHAVLLYGVFDQHPTAVRVAGYLVNWTIAEATALIVTPYLVLIGAPDHPTKRWERVIWLPAGILVLLGIGGTIRLLQATWIYIAAKIPAAWFERRSSLEASVGCARSLVALCVLVVLAAVFANRPRQWPVGTLLGEALTPDQRALANSMAYATCYFAVVAVLDVLIHRASTRKAGAGWRQAP